MGFLKNATKKVTSFNKKVLKGEIQKKGLAFVDPKGLTNRDQNTIFHNKATAGLSRVLAHADAPINSLANSLNTVPVIGKVAGLIGKASNFSQSIYLKEAGVKGVTIGFNQKAGIKELKRWNKDSTVNPATGALVPTTETPNYKAAIAAGEMDQAAKMNQQKNKTYIYIGIAFLIGIVIFVFTRKKRKRG